MQRAESQSSPSCLQIGVGLMSHVISWIDRVPLQQHLESRETSQQAVAEGREEEEGVDVVGLERSWKGGSNPWKIRAAGGQEEACFLLDYKPMVVFFYPCREGEAQIIADLLHLQLCLFLKSKSNPFYRCSSCAVYSNPAIQKQATATLLHFRSIKKESRASLMKRCSIPFLCNQRATFKWTFDYFWKVFAQRILKKV